MANANQITNDLLIKIPQRWPAVLCWRNNTGAGIGWSVVKAVVRLLKTGNIPAALKLLTRPIKWGLVGSSDIIAIVGPRGRFVGIEIKDPDTDDDQSLIQRAFEIQCKSLGAGYFIAEDVDGALVEFDLYARNVK